MLRKLEKDLEKAYGGFFFDMKIDKKTGILAGNPSLKFPTYPYIGSKYGKCRKILFIGMDIGSDEKEGGIQSFKERRAAIEEKELNKHNPHIAGTYICALHFLEREDTWGKYWKNIKNIPTCQQALKKEDALPAENPLSYVALTNYYKFVKPKRKNRTGGANRKHINPKSENELFLKEVEIFNPGLIIFQSKEFGKKKYDGLLSELKEKVKDIRIGPHPAYRGKREPEYFVGQLEKV